jgi:hypothetical protein
MRLEFMAQVGNGLIASDSFPKAKKSFSVHSFGRG